MRISERILAGKSSQNSAGPSGGAVAMVAALRGDAAALHGALSPTLLLLGGIADWKFVGFNFPPFSVFTVSFLRGDNSPPEKVIVLSQVPSPLSSSMQGGALAGDT